MGSRTSLCMLIVCSQVMVIAAVTDGTDVGVLNSIKSTWQKVPPSWGGSDPCGSNWVGISCTMSRVTSLNLAGMGLESDSIGDIPSLSQLQNLDLSNNRGISAPLPPSIENLKNLTTLMLVGCSFFGPIPDTIGSLSKLVFLGLNNNSFSGTIPPSIGNLASLSWLDLSDNKLQGPIPVSDGTTSGLDMLKNAKHFHLADNQLTGEIRSELFSSDMTLLHVIFNNNQLSGTIPSSIGLVRTLEDVRLDTNSLSGIVPQNITNLTSVTKLYLSNNNLSGPIPNITGMDLLLYVDMSNNSFDASDIPTWFTLSNLKTLSMEKTQLQGEISSVIFKPELEKLVLSNNGLNGTLDVGNNYDSNLTVDLTNNSIDDFTQKSTYTMSLNLEGNPVCEGGAAGRYCATPKPNIPNGFPSNSCPPTTCPSNKILSPNCSCAYPYVGTIRFLLHSFSDLNNTTYYKIFHDVLMAAFLNTQLPVESISIVNATIGEYLEYQLHIFPVVQDHFNFSGVSEIGHVINRQSPNLIKLSPFFGPFMFIDEPYCCFQGGKSSNHGAIIGVTVCSVVIVCLAISYAIYQRRKAIRAKQSNPFASWVMDNGNDAGGVPQLKGARWCSFEELKRCTNNFSERNIIGSGGYGKVYKGTLDTRHEVAIKRAQQGSLQGAHEFKTEIELLSRIHHKNVVALVGFCYEQGEQMLVYEYISNGTLKDNLTASNVIEIVQAGKSGMRLDWVKRLTIALDSAKGLTYLHELANPPIIHRDIKSNNILLDDHLIAKVADFGLSKLVKDSKDYVSTQVKGTLGYMDPEYYMTQQLTEKSDVYSFGVVMMELLTARPPIQNGKYIVREVNEAIDRSPNELHKLLDPYIRSSHTVVGLTKYVNLAMRCVQDLGVDRPKMGEVVREIEAIIDLVVLSLDSESPSTFSSQSTGKARDLYHPYSDSISDSSGLYVPFESSDSSSLYTPFETELRR